MPVTFSAVFSKVLRLLCGFCRILNTITTIPVPEISSMKLSTPKPNSASVSSSKPNHVAIIPSTRLYKMVNTPSANAISYNFFSCDDERLMESMSESNSAWTILKHISAKCDVVATVLHKMHVINATWFQTEAVEINLYSFNK